MQIFVVLFSTFDAIPLTIVLPYTYTHKPLKLKQNNEIHAQLPIPLINTFVCVLSTFIACNDVTEFVYVCERLFKHMPIASAKTQHNRIMIAKSTQFYTFASILLCIFANTRKIELKTVLFVTHTNVPN